MKVLFIQLSDMHCNDKDDKLNEKITKIPSALKHLGAVDHVILIFSGDLANTASDNEYKIGRKKMRLLFSELKKEFDCGFINTCIVPGNHDILLNDDCRNADEILSWAKNDHINDELNQMDNFFEYARSQNCFKGDKICDNVIIDFNSLKIQLSLLNSAPFSTRENTDKELHYFPVYVDEKLHRADDVDIKLSIIHHSYECCDWETKEMLRDAFKKDDIVFIGHDHKAESLAIKNGDGTDTNILMGGRFNLNPKNECTFNAVIFDTDTETFDIYTYSWDVSLRLFKNEHLNRLKKKSMMLTPSDSYVNDLLQDQKNSISGSIIDYFVVPKISVYGSEYLYNNDSKRLDANDIFEMLLDKLIIRISGAVGCGKTTLLKYLYSESIKKGFVPLFIEKSKFNDKRFDKILKDMFELQYICDYENFDQSDHSKEVIFIDDLDLVSSTDFSNKFVQFISASGRLLVFTTKDIVQDIETVAKERIKESEFRSLIINPFYKETRDELVNKVGKSFRKNEEDITTAITALDYLVQCQAKLFTSTPANLIQYILFFFNQNDSTDKGTKTLSLVFETNIRHSLLEVIKEKDATIYLWKR